MRSEPPPHVTISVQGLSATYRDSSGRRVEALRDVSFEIQPGERVGIIGRSGSGKTTLLRVLAGLVKPAAGTVEVCARRVSGLPPREYYDDVGVVFQDHGLIRQLTPVQNALCGTLHRYRPGGALARFSAEDRARAEEYLADLGLGDRLSVRSAKLSGGEKQRVAIARMLMQAPKVMLLDEPVASLDVHWTRKVMELLTEVSGEDTTTVAIMHDLQIAREWATRVLVIQDGELQFDGDPDEACTILEAMPAGLGGPPDATGEESGEATTTTPTEAPGIGRGPFYVLLGVALVALYVWAAIGVDLEASKVFGGLGKAADFLGRMLPPDTSVVPTVGASIVETVQMALLGTTFAALIGLPLSMAAARNVAPAPVRAVARLLLNTMRTIPSIIWGLFFVAIVGLGPFPGILALTFYATGYLGKFYYEGIEAIDPKPLIALRTTGASRLHRFRYGVFPQVLPLLAGYTLYMFEYNVRAASILGVVGAGGVGFYLYSYINNFTYPKATTALLMLLVLVTVIDAVSSRVRERLVI